MADIINLKNGLELSKHQASAEVEEQDFARRVIDSSNDGVLAYDRNCRYTIWNPALVRITGMRASEVLGKRAFDVFPFLEKTGLDRAFYEALAGRTTTIEAPISVPQTGRNGIVRSRHSPLYDEAGHVVGGLAIVRDVTETFKLSDDFDKTMSYLSDAIKLLDDCKDKRSLVKNALALAVRHFGCYSYLRLLKPEGTIEVYSTGTDFENPDRSMNQKQGEEYLKYLLDNSSLLVLSVPIITAGKLIGVLSLSSSEKPFSSNDSTVAGDLAQRIGLILEVIAFRER